MIWDEIKDQFFEAADYVENVFGKTIKICELFEALSKEILAVQDVEEEIFQGTEMRLGVLNLLTEIDDPESVPPEAFLRATEIFVRAQHMLSIMARVLPLMSYRAESCNKSQRGTLH